MQDGQIHNISRATPTPGVSHHNNVTTQGPADLTADAAEVGDTINNKDAITVDESTTQGPRETRVFIAGDVEMHLEQASGKHLFSPEVRESSLW
jgi:hypothetical protein